MDSARPCRSLGTMAAMILFLPGCYLAAVPFLIQNDFDDKRTALKKDMEKGIVSKEAAELSCLKMLEAVDKHHVAPPPYPPEICKFGSAGDKRYELTRLAERDQLSQDGWRQECLRLENRSAGDAACKFDPVGEKIVQWKRLVDTKQTSSEAAEMDCTRYVNEVRDANIQAVKHPKELCRF